MRRLGRVRIAVAAIALALLWTRGDAQTSPAVSATPAPPPLKPLRDGQHDFDFLIGKWKYHLKRLENPLTGSTKWIEFDGIGECRPLWNGKANLDTLDVSSPSGHIEGLTLRLYNPESHQWSLYWSNAAKGTVELPTVGSFADGKGEFYDQEPYRGRMIFVRYVWSATTTKSPHFEQSFSQDGGKTWEVNWITDQVRVE
jgi:hypothetical protein